MHNNDDKRKVSLARAKEFKNRISDYLIVKEKIPRGMSDKQEEKIRAKKEKILSILHANEDDWNNWEWQIRNRICNVELLSQIINLSASEIENIKKVEKNYRWGISPYYCALIDNEDKYNPVKLQSIPTIFELNEIGSSDPMAEEYTNPAGAITRRYPDRLIINVTNICPSFCRHCQRRRNIKTNDIDTSQCALKESIEYIRNNPEIRDVLITGGDALMLSDATLDWLIGEIYNIPTVDYIRLGTRVPVTLPQRITENLLNILKKYQPIYINTQFNHPLEVTRM